jgi:hypothetical protein
VEPGRRRPGRGPLRGYQVFHPSVAITDGDREGLIGNPGDFIVAYTLDYSDTDSDVLATRFTAGVRAWTVRVAASGSNESAPSIALNPAGGP